MTINKDHIVALLVRMSVLIAVIASSAYLIMLGRYNMLLLDDYGFVAEVDKGGAFGLMHNAYLYWQCRFSGFYVLGWLIKVWGHSANLVGYTIFMLLLGYATIYYALKNLIKTQAKWLLLGVSVLVTNVSIMSYLEISTFYWLCCALYTLSVYAAIALMTAIFFDKGMLWKRWLIVIICSLYLCGGAENFTPIVIAVVGLVLLYQMIVSRSWVFWKTTEQKIMLVSIAILIIGFVAVLIGPGTKSNAENRGTHGFMAHFALIPYIVQLAKASVIFYMRLLSRGLYYILLFPLGWLLGVKMKDAINVTNIKIGRAILISAIMTFAAIELSIAASVFGIGWYAPLRSYSFVSFIVAALVIYWGVLCGLSRDGRKIVSIFAIVTNLTLAGMSVYFYRLEQPMVADIHAQIENIHAQIVEHKKSNNTEPITIKAVEYPCIPNSYAIMRTMINKVTGRRGSQIAPPSEYFPYERYCLSCEPSDFKNKGVQRYLRVEFDIIGGDE